VNEEKAVDAEKAVTDAAKASHHGDDHGGHGHASHAEKHSEAVHDHDHDDHGHDHSDHTTGDAHDHAHDGGGAMPETMNDQLQANMDHYMDMPHLMAHVQDAYFIETPKFFGLEYTDPSGHTHSGFGIPNVLGVEQPIIGTPEKPIFTGRFSKFMAIELVVAILMFVIFYWLGQKIKSGDKPKGKIWNALEAMIVYIRDEVARPAIGKKDTDRFLPFVLTTFFFVLGLNLFGMIPGFGSATGSLAVTGVLALFVFGVVAGSGIKKMGFVQFLKAQVPTMDLPPALRAVLVPLIFVIEIFGMLVKHFVLAVRLFANMFAGHLVLAIFVAFIGVAAGTGLYYAVAPVAVAGSIAFSALELFVAFLQAYIFAFLASLFIGSAQHAH
jgi:F-type H+-transporting ATPase subunit a